MKQRTTIQIEGPTLNRLKSIRIFKRETYDEVLKSLIKALFVRAREAIYRIFAPANMHSTLLSHLQCRAVIKSITFIKQIFKKNYKKPLVF